MDRTISWIKNIGSQIVKSVEINCGSFRIQKYSGEYISAMVERIAEKKDIFDKMTGNVEINNPANAFGRVNTYPNALHGKRERAEPSIRGRTLYVYKCVVHADSKCAFPLISPVQRVVYNGDASPYTGTHPSSRRVRSDNYFPTSSPTLT
jgi:hypothetical protein